MNRQMKVPSADHPITIEPYAGRVLVEVGGQVLADTRAALIVREATYPAVAYVPRADADMALLGRSDHTTYCPYKGDCAYYSVLAGGARSRNAVWSYEAPYPAVSALEGYLACYPERVDSIALIPD